MLKVFRDSIYVGSLDMQADENFYGFRYDASYLGSSRALPLSLSLPLNEIRYSGEQSRPYFEGLLPEGDARDAIARRLGVSKNSSSKLLKALGRDCAGDVSIIEEDEEVAIGEAAYAFLEGGLEKIAQNPLEEIVRLQEETRLSLAGGQEKIALYHKDGEPLGDAWYVPLFDAPSTHILKPSVLDARYPNLTLNEYLCLNAAKVCGIATEESSLLFPEAPLLVVQRYDRRVENQDGPGELPRVTRIHQEDCCQACGVESDLKYEREGGPGFGRIRDLLAYHARQPISDIKTLAGLGLFNFFIGNCDAHAKNFSLIQNSNSTIALAPAYDLICTTIYDGTYGQKVSRSMGMKMGIHENIDKIDADDLRAFAEALRLRPKALVQMGETLTEVLPHALELAGSKASQEGFSAAEEMVDRIGSDMKKRVSFFQSASHSFIG